MQSETHAERRDKEFWYPDGNVVLRVGNKLFRLHRSRLEKYCIFFQQLFAADVDVQLSEIIDGCPVYHVPPDLSPKGFKDLMNALETPLYVCTLDNTREQRLTICPSSEFVAKPPSQTLAISLLHAAHTLACDVICRLAKTTLCDIWEAERPPNHDGSDRHAFQEAIYIVQLSRLFDIPGVRKRAFYELSSSQEFWSALATDRQSIKLPEADIIRLYDARLALGQMWRRFVWEAPGKDDKLRCLSGPHWSPGACRFDSTERSTKWIASMKDLGEVEAGEMDPLRYNVIEHRQTELVKHWCVACLESKE